MSNLRVYLVLDLAMHRAATLTLSSAADIPLLFCWLPFFCSALSRSEWVVLSRFWGRGATLAVAAVVASVASRLHVRRHNCFFWGHWKAKKIFQKGQIQNWVKQLFFHHHHAWLWKKGFDATVLYSQFSYQVQSPDAHKAIFSGTRHIGQFGWSQQQASQSDSSESVRVPYRSESLRSRKLTHEH